MWTTVFFTPGPEPAVPLPWREGVGGWRLEALCPLPGSRLLPGRRLVVSTFQESSGMTAAVWALVWLAAHEEPCGPGGGFGLAWASGQPLHPGLHGLCAHSGRRAMLSESHVRHSASAPQTRSGARIGQGGTWGPTALLQGSDLSAAETRDCCCVVDRGKRKTSRGPFNGTGCTDLGVQVRNQGGKASRSQGAQDAGRAPSPSPTLCTKEFFSPKLGNHAQWSGRSSVRVSKRKTEAHRAPCCTHGMPSLIPVPGS